MEKQPLVKLENTLNLHRSSTQKQNIIVAENNVTFLDQEKETKISSDKAPYLKNDEVIFTAPDGEQFDQSEANKLSLKENVIILCGHYKGIDQRVRDVLITKEYTIGDYVLSGGELPAMVITDALVRLIPNAIGDAGSALSDSFQDGLLEAPVYTRPAEFKGLKVPEILRSGDHKKIEAWKAEQSLERTKERRKDLYEKFKKDY